MIDLAQLSTREKVCYVTTRPLVSATFHILGRSSDEEVTRLILSRLSQPQFVEQTRIGDLKRLLIVAKIDVDDTEDEEMFRVMVQYAAASKLAANGAIPEN